MLFCTTCTKNKKTKQINNQSFRNVSILDIKHECDQLQHLTANVFVATRLASYKINFSTNSLSKTFTIIYSYIHISIYNHKPSQMYCVKDLRG